MLLYLDFAVSERRFTDDYALASALPLATKRYRTLKD
jgi:hypothetical protein